MVTDITTMMPGTIISIEVKAGDRVSTGQELAIIESMKMEVPIESPFNGIVVEVLVSEGSAVDDGAVVLRLTSD